MLNPTASRRKSTMVIALSIALIAFVGLFIAARAGLLKFTANGSTTRFSVDLQSWHCGSQSQREILFDEIPRRSPLLPPGIVWSVRDWQVGPILIESRHQVPPRPGDEVW